ncbi:hypothetical protein [Sphingomicrobium sediminis]|uniref:Uncharacterized protein n=1 Tax=Sphingomicrobium sediminis TaxID=2950949 RepID=A0A9X2EI22_9SPHN|nr:hypothetical protein [Sphingomicrobium sediminis]MCM8558438.1 hypothetical protein [Sphingomicrobium sediminis]
MFGEGRPEEILVGIVSAALAVLLAIRIRHALTKGVVPIYKKRISRSEVGEAKFNFVVIANAVGMLLLLWISADLIFQIR